MPYYQRHIFFCTNSRANNKKCCADGDAENMRKHVKKRLKKLDLHRPSQTRTSTSGCLGRCQQGPLLVIYPDNIWYRYHSVDDLDEIIDTHILKGELVTRLLIADN